MMNSLTQLMNCLKPTREAEEAKSSVWEIEGLELVLSMALDPESFVGGPRTPPFGPFLCTRFRNQKIRKSENQKMERQKLCP